MSRPTTQQVRFHTLTAGDQFESEGELYRKTGILMARNLRSNTYQTFGSFQFVNIEVDHGAAPKTPR